MKRLCSFLVACCISVSASAETAHDSNAPVRSVTTFEQLVYMNLSDERYFFGLPYAEHKDGYGSWYSLPIAMHVSAIAFKGDTLSIIGVSYEIGNGVSIRSGYAKDDLVATSFLGAHISGKSFLLQIEKRCFCFWFVEPR